MSIVFAARSVTMVKWAKDVGLGQHLYLVGVADDAEDMAKRLESGWCAVQDWSVVAKADAENLDQDAVVERLKKREKMVDPALYPRLKGQAGVFKVKAENVENHVMVAKALAGEEPKDIKLKPALIGSYLVQNALR